MNNKAPSLYKAPEISRKFPRAVYGVPTMGPFTLLACHWICSPEVDQPRLAENNGADDEISGNIISMAVREV